MIIYYDSHCKMCVNSSTVWQKLDKGNKLRFESFRDLDHYPSEMEESLHVYTENKWFQGYTAIIEIVKKLPVLWVLLPFLVFGKWIGLGDTIYQWVAKNRKLIPVNQCKDGDHCRISSNHD